MEDLNTLRMKKEMLLIELSAIEQKISLFEKATTVTSVPESENSETKASPVQTATGKDSTNPLKAEVLLKSLIKETTTPIPEGTTSSLVQTKPTIEGLDRMTILSPTNKRPVQELELVPDYRKALQKEPERFYVIYKGPHTGVHSDWGLVESFCKKDKVTCRKFRNEASARFSLATYTADGSSEKNPLLRPRIQALKEERKDQRFLIFREASEQSTVKVPLEFEEFRMLWNKARAACPEDFVHEKFYTTDKKSKSLYNFIEGADPQLVYQAFQAGLVHNIYPSCNLQELKFFPSKMVETIKNFRKKVLKAKDDPIYIQIISSVPDWLQDAIFPPYYFIEIGLSKAKKEIDQSQPMEDKDLPLTELLHTVRINGLRRIATKILETITESKKKINYADGHCIITSWSFKGTTEEDEAKISSFGEQFMFNNIVAGPKTKQSFCKQAEQLFEGHNCSYCSCNDEGPSTEDDKSTSD